MCLQGLENFSLVVLNCLLLIYGFLLPMLKQNYGVTVVISFRRFGSDNGSLALELCLALRCPTGEKSRHNVAAGIKLVLTFGGVKQTAVRSAMRCTNYWTTSKGQLSGSVTLQTD